MAVQAELVAIANKIIRTEDCVLHADNSFRWANNRDFTPGLFLDAYPEWRPSNPEDYRIDLRLIESGSWEGLTVYPSLSNSEAYEDETGQFFLKSFRAYLDRQSFGRPVGLAGLKEVMALSQNYINV